MVKKDCRSPYTSILVTVLALVISIAGFTTATATSAEAATATQESAASWARGKVGSTSYRYLCLKFVYDAYIAAGMSRSALDAASGYKADSNSYPADQWNYWMTVARPSGTLRVGYDAAPPVGAIIYFSNSLGHDYSHTTLSVGGGQQISPDTDLVKGPQSVNTNSNRTMLGWWLPDQSPAPSDPPKIVAGNDNGQMTVQLSNFPTGAARFFCHTGDATGFPFGGSVTNSGGSPVGISSSSQYWGSGWCSGRGNFWVGVQAPNGSDYYSNQVVLGPPVTAPSPPMGVNAQAGDASSVVTWGSPESDGGASIDNFTATASPGGAECSAGASLSCTVVGLTNGIPYTFTVRAHNPAGWSQASVASSAVTPRSPDHTAPIISAVTPGKKSRSNPVTTTVTVKFSEPVNGVDSSNFLIRSDSTGRGIDASVVYDSATQSATLTPTNPLEADSAFAVSVGVGSPILDMNGNSLSFQNWVFYTGPAPTVTAKSPGAGAVAVATDSNVAVTFSEPVQWGAAAATVKDTSGNSVPFSTSYGSTPNVVTLGTAGSLKPDTKYTVTILGGTGGVKDVSGNPVTPSSWTFTTGPVPVVSSQSPLANASAVAVSANVTATFNEPVKSVSGTTFKLRNSAGTIVAATVSYDESTRVATLNPTNDLTPGTVYTATLTGGSTAIRDTAGNPLTSSSWSFTAAVPDTTRPTVTTKSPAAGTTGVTVGTNVTATFSEAVQGVDASSFQIQATGADAMLPATVTYNSSTRVATLNPDADLLPSTQYSVIVWGGGVRDAAGNTNLPTLWQFTTASPDTTAPTLTSKTPTDGSTGIAVSTNVTATFSEPVTGVSSSSFKLFDGNGNTVYASVTYNSSTRTAVLNPTSDLPPGGLYLAAFNDGSAAIRDYAGNSLGRPTWWFRT